MTVSQNITITVLDPPADLPHNTRAEEIKQLPDFLSAALQRDDGTDYIVTSAAYRDSSGNAGRVYFALNASTNALEGIFTKVGGVWTRWQVTADDFDATMLDDNLYLDTSDGKIKIYFDNDTIYEGEEDTTDGSASLGKKPLIVRGYGYGLVERIDDAGLKFFDVNPDGGVDGSDPATSGGSIELYDAGSGVYKIRVKAGGITPAMFSAPAFAQVPIASTQLSSANGVIQTPFNLRSADAVVSGDITVSATGITPALSGWYRVSISMQTLSDSLAFDGGAAHASLTTAAYDGFSSGYVSAGEEIYPAGGSFSPYAHFSGTGLVYLTAGIPFRMGWGVSGSAIASGTVDSWNPTLSNRSIITLEYVGAGS